jgi:LysR family carnitine catabolism transcriptional activator
MLVFILLIRSINLVSIKNISAFVAVAQSQSFADASHRMHLSQPALSSAVKKLEEQLGGRLFSRSTRRVKLTPEGAAFLPVARRLIADLENAIFDVKQLFNLEQGLLSIAAMPSFAEGKLPSLLSSFGYAQPGIGVRVIDEVMENVIQSVIEQRVEIGFSFAPEDNDLVDFTPLFTDEFVLIMNEAHTLNQVENLRINDLSGHAFVAMNRGSSTRNWIEHTFEQQDLKVKVAAEASQFSTIGNLVASGLGVSIVPSMCIEQVRAKGCVAKQVDGLNIVKSVGYITSKEAALSAIASAFISTLSL